MIERRSCKRCQMLFFPKNKQQSFHNDFCRYMFWVEWRRKYVRQWKQDNPEMNREQVKRYRGRKRARGVNFVSDV